MSIDGRGQGNERAAGHLALELHEHQVPDLEPVVRLARVLAGLHRALGQVEVDFRAGAAGARVAHAPEVVGLAQAANALDRHAGLRPQRGRFFVGGNAVFTLEDRHREPLDRQAQHLRHEFPAPGDGVGLEVVAEAEVAEHLEERVVARGEAHVVEVVVLAAGAHALLGGGGAGVVARLAAGEHVLELHHAGVGEEQRGVVRRHQGRRGDAAVGALLEELQECFANLIRRHVGGHAHGLRHALTDFNDVGEPSRRYMHAHVAADPRCAPSCACRE